MSNGVNLENVLVVKSTKKREYPFKPGMSGNPAGKPKGARNRLSNDFLEAVSKEFKKRGPKAIEDLDSKEFIQVCVALLPRIIELDDDSKKALNNMNSVLPFDAIYTRIKELPKSESPRLDREVDTLAS